MISSLVSWDHSQEYDFPKADEFLGGGVRNTYIYKIDTSDIGQYKYLHDHEIDEKPLFPATGYIVLAWTSLAKYLSLQTDSTRLAFKDVVIHRPCSLSNSEGTAFMS